MSALVLTSHLWDPTALPGAHWRSAPRGATPEGPLPTTVDEALTWAQAQHGQFAAVIPVEGATLLVTDFGRTIPLLCTRVGGRWVVADHPRPLLEMMPEARLDADGAFQFRHAGFVLGQRTLIEGMWQVPASSVVELRDGEETPRAHMAHMFRYGPDRTDDEQSFAAGFLAALDAAVSRTVELAGQRQIAVPLSGGIDSRLLMALLCRAEAKRVLAFTYGVPGSTEAEVSRTVAQEIGAEWVFVPTDAQKVRRAWIDEGGAFLEDGWAGACLPHYQDWFALRELTGNGTLEPGAVVLPGHTVVGNLHDEQVVTQGRVLGRRELAEVLADHHFCLQGRPRDVRANKVVVEEMRAFLDEINWEPTSTHVQSWIEWFNIRERQAKYINNSMRAYEHFGLDWALPMLDRGVVRAWESGCYTFTDGPRHWYARFTSDLYARTTGAGGEYWAPTLGRLDSRVKGALVSVLRATRADEAARRILSTRTQLNHPMAFEAFLGTHRSSQYVKDLLGGRTLQGVFADLFLADDWAPGTAILPH
ncbi:asparagine synthetase B family protein [Schaalia sp. 19OD2882]|uniref:asparagine synthase-related protein n=1 Tax=Schaalia sp. 19OD2882 TaxID=2794089 RepID=UPI001C1EB87A|nr:asparagine synthase C-terminal domain-containing protein [Schaalia sp. 19OD2882]QWW20278.1 asparagine synthetase B family protein [Schaalia sp. 19OD2882]